jgi:topoisomerase IA-like protein
MAKYSKGAGNKVERAMHEKKEGTLKSGRSGKKVTSRKQAIAIGLSEARKKGSKVPKKKSATRKAATKKSAPRKSASKKAASKKS